MVSVIFKSPKVKILFVNQSKINSNIYIKTLSMSSYRLIFLNTITIKSKYYVILK